MRSIKEALALDSMEEIEKEVADRYDLRRQMVGTLYPRILYDEICQLNARHSFLRRQKEAERAAASGCIIVTAGKTGR